MKTKRICAILLFFCLPLSLAACRTTPSEPQRSIVETFGYRRTRFRLRSANGT